MNSLEYEIVYLKYKCFLFMIILILSITTLLIIVFCDECTKYLDLDYLIFFISLCIVFMTISAYFIAVTLTKLKLLISVTNIVDIDTLNIEYMEDEVDENYNNEL